jgi:tRNA G18 (ribose-2'-O)-methylase SpoU
LDILESKGIQTHGQALICGEKAISEILNEKSLEVLGIIRTEKMQMPAGIQDGFDYILSNELFKQVDGTGSHFPILLIKVPLFNTASDIARDEVSLALAFQDPSNVGAVLRSAAAFGVKQILLLPGCSHPFHPKSSRAASGTLGLFEFFKLKTWEELESLELPLVGLDAEGSDIRKAKMPQNFILVPGLEGPGLPQDIKWTHTLKIPMEKGVESLNGAVAASLALYELYKNNG